MELQDYIAIVRKRWLSILVITLLGAGAAFAASTAMTPQYTARSQVFVSVRTGDTTTDLIQGSSFTQRQVKSYTDLVTSPRVLIPVIDHLDLATTPDELASMITASSPLDTVLITINATHPDPRTASDIANATGESLASLVTELEQPAEGPSPVEISTVRYATPPAAPTSPRPVRNTALGLVLGLAVGFGLAVLREILDTRVRSADDVRAVTDASILSVMTFDADAPKHPLIVHVDPQSPRAEAVRRLRTNLQFLDLGEELTSIVVTSALPGEGKSTITANLAITLADAGKRVVLVDADLRRPSVAEYMGVEGQTGLTTVLIGRATLTDVTQPWGDGNLHVLPSGQVPPNPSEMIGSQAMRWVIGQLTQQYDMVIVDAPPLLPVTDAAILSRVTSGALMVTAAHRSHRSDLAEGIDALDAVGARLLGIVLNRVPRKHGDSYTYYDQEGQRKRRSSRRRPARATLHSRRPKVSRMSVARVGAGGAGAGAGGAESGSVDELLGWVADDEPAAPPPGLMTDPADDGDPSAPGRAMPRGHWPGQPLG